MTTMTPTMKTKLSWTMNMTQTMKKFVMMTVPNCKLPKSIFAPSHYLTWRLKPMIYVAPHVFFPKPQRRIPSLDGRKSYYSTAATTIQKQYYVGIFGPVDHLYSDYTLVAHHVVTKFSVKEGINIFKERGEQSVSTELTQLHLRDTFEPVDPNTLNHQ